MILVNFTSAMDREHHPYFDDPVELDIVVIPASGLHDKATGKVMAIGIVAILFNDSDHISQKIPTHSSCSITPKDSPNYKVSMTNHPLPIPISTISERYPTLA